MSAEAITATMTQHGWTWNSAPDHPNLLELKRGEQLLAWIHKRPHYCDRGHWQVQVECVPALDAADCFPRYFMRRETAQQELIEFLAWRLHGERIAESEVEFGDVIVPKSHAHSTLRSGAQSYNHAICLSVVPFIVVSEEADMVWRRLDLSAYIGLFKAPAEIIERCQARLRRDAAAERLPR
jgi:hypothetical protein